MRSVNFSQESLPRQYQYLKRNLQELGVLGNFDNFEQKAQRKIEEFIQDTIDKEFDEQIGAKRYEHSPARQDKRKGGYERYLTTSFGISRVHIPRTRGKIKVNYSLFDRYQRRRKHFDDMVVLSMILGLSSRKQRRFFKSFIGDAVSHATASRLLKTLEYGLKEFRTAPIEDKYKYILIDGFWIKIKERYICNRPILFVLGVTTDNKKEIIAFKLAKGETEEEASALLNDIYRRGLKGKNLKLIASDGAKGIRAAINMIYPYAKWQLCYTHKLRNLSHNIRYKKRHRRKLMAQARSIFQTKTKRQAIKRYTKLCNTWQDIEPYAIKCFRKDFHDTLGYYEFMDDKNFISTTNHLERDLEEIRRRIKIQGYFKNNTSANLWTFGIISQFRERQPKTMPRYTFTLIKEHEYESVQLS
jgi:transposase-like protein